LNKLWDKWNDLLSFLTKVFDIMVFDNQNELQNVIETAPGDVPEAWFKSPFLGDQS